MGSSSMGPGMISTPVSLQQARESQLLQQMQSAVNSGQSSPDQLAKIKKGAKEFETLLLSGWLQQAEQSLATVPGAEDDDDAGARDQMMSLGVQTLAESMAANGGIGIAAMITRAMTAMAERTQAAGGPSGPAATGAEISPKNEPFPLNSTAGNADRMAVSRKGSK
jgi:Rod binding domain-containing protein